MTKTDKSYKVQDKDSTAKPRSHSTAPLLAGGLAGGLGGVATADYRLRTEVRHTLEDKDWFAALERIRDQKIEAATRSGVLAEDLSGEGNRLHDFLRGVEGEYISGCEKIMEERGVTNWSQRWKHLNQGQKTKTVLFAAGAAVAVGSITYLVANALQDKTHHVLDNIEKRMAPAR